MRVKIKTEYPCGAKKEVELRSIIPIYKLDDDGGCPLHGKECKEVYCFE